jgi:hypothetical protein
VITDLFCLFFYIDGNITDEAGRTGRMRSCYCIRFVYEFETERKRKRENRTCKTFLSMCVSRAAHSEGSCIVISPCFSFQP